MKKVEFELDATRNVFAEIILGAIRFFKVPINLFKKYFKKFGISKKSRFYNLVNYPLANLLIKYFILGLIIEYLFVVGLVLFEFDQKSIIIASSLLALIVFTPSLLKVLFIMLVMITEMTIRITRSIFFTLKSLFTEKEYY
jgi:hypothetical protein